MEFETTIWPFGAFCPFIERQKKLFTDKQDILMLIKKERKISIVLTRAMSGAPAQWILVALSVSSLLSDLICEITTKAQRRQIKTKFSRNGSII